MTDLFRPRTRLRAADLDEVRRRLVLVDGHHVAKVHGRTGVIEGLDLTVTPAPEPSRLVVGPGAAYTVHGDLVRLAAPVELVPRRLGVHGIWLNADSRVIARSLALGRHGTEVMLGTGRVAIDPIPSRGLAWDDPPTTVGRTRIPDPIPPYVAAGRERLGLRDIEIDPVERTLVRRVSTIDGEFEQPPLYFATMAVTNTLRPSDLGQLGGWHSTICDATATGFTLTVHLLADDEIFELLAALRNISPTEFSLIGFDISWIGVDPRRPGTSPIDLPCAVLPALPPPPIEGPIL